MLAKALAAAHPAMAAPGLEHGLPLCLLKEAFTVSPRELIPPLLSFVVSKGSSVCQKTGPFSYFHIISVTSVVIAD